MHVDLQQVARDGSVTTVSRIDLRDGVAVSDDDAGRRFLAGIVVVEPGVGRVMPDEGERYLRALQRSYRGTYGWATEPLDD